MTRWSSVPVIVTLLSIILMAEGFKTINEVCNRNSANPTDPRNCDPAQYLICGKTGLCNCNTNLSWQKDLDKCTFPVRGVCTDSFGSPGWPSGDGQHGGNGPSPGCPVHSTCDLRGTGRCECNEGYEANDDFSECNGGRMIQTTQSISKRIRTHFADACFAGPSFEKSNFSFFLINRNQITPGDSQTRLQTMDLPAPIRIFASELETYSLLMFCHVPVSGVDEEANNESNRFTSVSLTVRAHVPSTVGL
ncbi:unnamed protein product [Allacma fusca]|uniref:Uncharacterized protein n=1 Tax=Allacma fusca TaxID=39272 RepID=A0A8J2NQQ2_9HEXA|nr:unnamed protein product [Allacma fusca]